MHAQHQPGVGARQDGGEPVGVLESDGALGLAVGPHRRVVQDDHGAVRGRRPELLPNCVELALTEATGHLAHDEAVQRDDAQATDVADGGAQLVGRPQQSAGVRAVGGAGPLPRTALKA